MSEELKRRPSNPNIPKLSPKKEERLKPADEKSAEGYDALEDAVRKTAELRHQIEEVSTVTILVEEEKDKL